MAVYAILILVIVLCVYYLIHGNYLFSRRSLSIRFLLYLIIFSIIYFIITYIVFGLLSMLRESAIAEGNIIVDIIVAIVSIFVMPLVFLAEHIDRICFFRYDKCLPSFLYFPLSFILNSLLYGYFISRYWQRKTFRIVDALRNIWDFE